MKAADYSISAAGTPTVDVESIIDGIVLLRLDIPVYFDIMTFKFPLMPVAREQSELFESLLKDSQEEIDALKASVTALQEDNAAITSEVTLLHHENAVLKEADAAITSEVTTLRQENGLLKEGNVLLREAVAMLENDVAVLKSTKLQIISLRQSAKCVNGDNCTWGTEVVNTARSLFQRSADFKIITIITAGIYRVTARVPAPAGNQGYYASISINLNGTAIASSCIWCNIHWHH